MAAGLNVSAFYYDFQNKQNTLATNPLIATERIIVNVDDEIYGVEFDGQFALTDEFTLAGSYSYIDGTAGDIINPFTGNVDPSSREELPFESFAYRTQVFGQPRSYGATLGVKF